MSKDLLLTNIHYEYDLYIDQGLQVGSRGNFGFSYSLECPH